MKILEAGKGQRLSYAYFFVATLLLLAEAFRNTPAITVLRPMLIPILIALYSCTSRKRNKIYIVALAFALLSNVLLLTGEITHVIYAIITFLLYRLLIIIIVVRYTAKFHLLAFAIAIVPFFFLFAYLIDMTSETLADGLYPSIANAIVMSVLAALSLSNYIFEDDRRNSWLLISSLLFVVLMFIFVIERFYLTNPVFRPLSVLVFAAAHYAFYKYMILTERDILTSRL